MKILVIGYYYSMNLGDTVICDCVASWLRETFPSDEVVIRDIWGRGEYTGSPDISLQMIRKQRMRVQIRTWLTRFTPYDSQLAHEQYVLEKYGVAMQKIADEPCDLAVFAGGQLLTDLMSHELSFYIRAFDLRRIPVFLHALGTGPCHSRNLNRELYEALHRSSVVYISVRDQLDEVNKRYFDSRSEMNDGADARHAVFAADSGLWAADVYRVSKKQGSGTIGLGVMYPGNIPAQKAVRFWTGLICLLNKNGVSWQIFTNGDNRDQLFAAYILGRLPFLTKDQRERCCAPPPDGAESLVRRISSYQGIISFRLHSHIIAASLHVPSVAIVWDDKLREFFSLFGCGDRCLLISDPPEKVLETYHDALQSGWPEKKVLRLRQESRKMLEQAVEQYR